MPSLVESTSFRPFALGLWIQRANPLWVPGWNYAISGFGRNTLPGYGVLRLIRQLEVKDTGTIVC